MLRRIGESAKGELVAALAKGDDTEQFDTITEGGTIFPWTESWPSDKVIRAAGGIEYLREVRDKAVSSIPEIPDKFVVQYSVTFCYFKATRGISSLLG
jgi:hypothetical protein